MNPEITKEHFDKAVKQRWHGETCLIAQWMISNGIDPARVSVFEYTKSNSQASDARLRFDAYFHRPGDEKKVELQALRESLPILVNV